MTWSREKAPGPRVSTNTRPPHEWSVQAMGTVQPWRKYGKVRCSIRPLDCQRDGDQMNVNTCATAFAAALVMASPVLGHHSDAGVDTESVIAFEGTVRELAWRNPHVYIVVETEQSGEPVEWELQMGAVSGLTRRGWTRDTLSPGDQVTIRASPAVGGRPYGILRSVEKAGGLALGAAAPVPDVTPPAATLAGKWLTDRSSVLDFPAGSFDAFFRAMLVLNEKGEAAQAALDSLSADNACSGVYR